MNTVSCDEDYACTTSGLLVFFPGVFLSSRVTGACPVTTDLNMRLNVRTIGRVIFDCMPAGRHSDSSPDSKRVRLCSRLPCGSYGAGSPTAVVVCSRELVSCGNGGTMLDVVEWIPAAM